MLAKTSIYARIQVGGHSAPRQGRRRCGLCMLAAGQKIRSVWAYTASASRRKRPSLKNGAPTFLLLSAAKKSADITVAKSMTCVK